MSGHGAATVDLLAERNSAGALQLQLSTHRRFALALLPRREFSVCVEADQLESKLCPLVLAWFSRLHVWAPWRSCVSDGADALIGSLEERPYHVLRAEEDARNSLEALETLQDAGLVYPTLSDSDQSAWLLNSSVATAGQVGQPQSCVL